VVVGTLGKDSLPFSRCFNPKGISVEHSVRVIRPSASNVPKGVVVVEPLPGWEDL